MQSGSHLLPQSYTIKSIHQLRHVLSSCIINNIISTSAFSLISNKMSSTFSCVCVVSNVQVCFTWLLWKVKIKAERSGTKKKSQLFSAAKWFFFFSSFFTLSDSISRSIGISGVTRHEISPILGFRRNSILKPPEICGHITFSTSGQITLLCDSCKGKNCGDGKFPTLVKCFLTEAIKRITSDST